MIYTQWDIIADLYIPLLLLCSLSVLLRTRNKPDLKKKIATLASSILTVYSLMLIDNWLRLWAYFDLDYSTHTALALTLVFFLSNNKRCTFIATSSIVMYFLLMMYRQYHSVLDIASTTIILLPLLYFIMKKSEQQKTTPPI